MLLAIVPIPSCLTLPLSQLKSLKENGIIDHYELSKDKVALYWTYLKKDEIKTVSLEKVVKWESY